MVWGGGGDIRESVRSRPRPRDEGEDGGSPEKKTLLGPSHLS